MTGLAEPGMRIYVSAATSKTAKLPYSWTLTCLGPQGLVGINTQMPNKIISEALEHKSIPGLQHISLIKPEVKIEAGTRLDFAVNYYPHEGFMEVKNVHLVRTKGLAEFPDSKTDRGRKHLNILENLSKTGYPCAMVYVIQRGDCEAMRFADDIDPAYAVAARQAALAGVQFHAVDCHVSTRTISLSRHIPILGLD